MMPTWEELVRKWFARLMPDAAAWQVTITAEPALDAEGGTQEATSFFDTRHRVAVFRCNSLVIPTNAIACHEVVHGLTASMSHTLHTVQDQLPDGDCTIARKWLQTEWERLISDLARTLVAAYSEA
jgi:hypothetical protein